MNKESAVGLLPLSIMRLKAFLFTLLLLATCFCRSGAQFADSAWSLPACVAYAQAHNITIRQNVLNERLAQLRLQQSRYAQLPSVNISSTYGQSFGRSINPTTNQFENGSYRFLSAGANADVLLFGWFSRRYNVQSNDLAAKAAAYDVAQFRDDVALNVATGYLRALLAKEQIALQQEQIRLTSAQLDQTRRFVSAGRLPELNTVQLASQLATDSAAYITAFSDYQSALLDLKALLNLDFRTPFGVAQPPAPAEMLAAEETPLPETIYEMAAARFGSIQGAQLKIESAELAAKSAAASRWPQLSLNAQLGNNWASNYRTVSGYELGNLTPSGQYFTQTPGDTAYTPVYTLSGTPVFQTVPFGTQFQNNFRQLVGVSVNVPLFNGWQAQAAYRQALINTEAAQLTLQQNALVLKQNIYKAWTEARNARQKYLAARNALESAEEARLYAEKRYALGLTTTVEYLVTQNARYRAAATMQSAYYDFLFRQKVLDFYQGKPLQL